MRIISSLILVVLFSASASAGEPSVARNKIEKLNQHSLASVGISLNALRYLAGARPGSFIPLWYLEQSGDYASVQELEKAGYAKVSRQLGLPDGREKATTFVNISLVGEGVELQRALLELQRGSGAAR